MRTKFDLKKKFCLILLFLSHEIYNEPNWNIFISMIFYEKLIDFDILTVDIFWMYIIF